LILTGTLGILLGLVFLFMFSVRRLKFMPSGWPKNRRLFRGRYIRTSDAKLKPSSIYSLVETEDHPVWGFLYRHGSSFPLVSAAYGNAVFQGSDEPSTFLVYVSTSGFLTRRIEKQ